MPEFQPLPPTALTTTCDAAQFGFATTAELTPDGALFGQERAAAAVRLAIDIAGPGYNVFVLGEPGCGRHAAVNKLLRAHAASRPVPADWCYVNNFDTPNKPRALTLPAGRGRALRADMQGFVTELGTAIVAGFDSDEYRSRVEAIQRDYKRREEGALRELGDEAGKQGVALLRTPQGFAFVPMKNDEAMDPSEFGALPEAERARIGGAIEALSERLHKLMNEFPRLRREMQSRIRDANRETLQLAVGHLVDELVERYADLPVVVDFLGEVRRDVVEVGEGLRGEAGAHAEAANSAEGGVSLQRYLVNLIVDHGSSTAAPLVFEDHPAYPNLVGRVDHVAHMGTLVTNFTLVQAGALHRANGGYLVLDAIKVLTQPYAWEGLKRALKSGEIRIESLAQVFGWVATLPLEPEPIPLGLKVVLIGERAHYYLLKELDPEFEELFKIAADFEDTVVRTPENTARYGELVGALARGQGLKPVERAAVARLADHSARLASDAERLSTRTRPIADLLREADHYAGEAGRAAVAREDVEQALAAAIRRADRARELTHEAVLRETVLVSTSGAHLGQINGLAVIELGDFRFGRPVRITATARLGEGDVVDIEREAELGGAIHSKGVMILSSFLAARYAAATPLSLAASLVFEQSYGPVEGDSASLAELCALLSVLAGTPIRQSLAVTGSVNQHGQVQAIGGVNEKIEGFFDICAARGLTGEQGVLVPEANVKNLMLREDVVAAAAAGRFHIYAVREVDAAIALLTGVAAGEAHKPGEVPGGGVNYRVASRLAALSEMRRSFAATREHGKGRGGEF